MKCFDIQKKNIWVGNQPIFWNWFLILVTVMVTIKGVNLKKIKVAGVRNGHQNIRLPRWAVSIKCYLLLK